MGSCVSASKNNQIDDELVKLSYKENDIERILITGFEGLMPYAIFNTIAAALNIQIKLKNVYNHKNIELLLYGFIDKIVPMPNSIYKIIEQFCDINSIFQSTIIQDFDCKYDNKSYKFIYHPYNERRKILFHFGDEIAGIIYVSNVSLFNDTLMKDIEYYRNIMYYKFINKNIPRILFMTEIELLKNKLIEFNECFPKCKSNNLDDVLQFVKTLFLDGFNSGRRYDGNYQYGSYSTNPYIYGYNEIYTHFVNNSYDKNELKKIIIDVLSLIKHIQLPLSGLLVG